MIGPTRIKKYNSSMHAVPVWKWKIQVKRGRRWHDYRVDGAVKMFENPWHAENSRKLVAGEVKP